MYGKPLARITLTIFLAAKPMDIAKAKPIKLSGSGTEVTFRGEVYPLNFSPN